MANVDDNDPHSGVLVYLTDMLPLFPVIYNMTFFRGRSPTEIARELKRPVILMQLAVDHLFAVRAYFAKAYPEE